MRGDKLLEKIALTDPKYIEEAEEKRIRKKIKTPVFIAACFLLILTVAALPLFKSNEPQKPPTAALTTDDLTAKTTDSHSTDTADTPKEPELYEGIPYSTLDISDTGLDSTLDDIGCYSIGDVAPFKEEYVIDCEMIVECTVKDVRVKHYEFVTDYDKFQSGGTTRYKSDSVIYEIEIEKVYKGDIVNPGECFIIEDETFFPNQMFYLKENHRYVLPILQSSKEIGIRQGEVIEGTAEKESQWTTYHPCYPPVEITLDGYYLFYDGWATLAASENAYRVTMDVPFNSDKAFFNDKIMIIDAESFDMILKELLNKN